MMRTYYLSILILFEVSVACTGTTYRIRGEEIHPGVYKVMQTSGFVQVPGSIDRWDSIGTQRMVDYQARMDSVLADKKLVFIARLDSVIERTPYLQPPLPEPLPLPDYELKGASSFGGPGASNPDGELFLRILVDTIIRGALPLKKFWIKTSYMQSTCGENFRSLQKTRFLNFSDTLGALQDIRLQPWSTLFCVGCPGAYLFDGRFLRSPEFSVLSLDIRELFPGYPVSLHDAKPHVQTPLRPDGKLYRPDGRSVGFDSAGKTPARLLR